MPLAQARAAAWTLYGREQEALRALDAVDWRGKAPLVQAGGLASESMVELLCRRNALRALALAEKARALAEVSKAIPGAARSARSHNLWVAVAGAVQGGDPASDRHWLEAGAQDAANPISQLYASFGLALALERSGDFERAGQLRDFLRQVAPHCAPLHATLEQFAASGARQ